MGATLMPEWRICRVSGDPAQLRPLSLSAPALLAQFGDQPEGQAEQAHAAGVFALRQSPRAPRAISWPPAGPGPSRPWPARPSLGATGGHFPRPAGAGEPARVASAAHCRVILGTIRPIHGHHPPRPQRPSRQPHLPRHHDLRRIAGRRSRVAPPARPCPAAWPELHRHSRDVPGAAQRGALRRHRTHHRQLAEPAPGRAFAHRAGHQGGRPGARLRVAAQRQRRRHRRRHRRLLRGQPEAAADRGHRPVPAALADAQRADVRQPVPRTEERPAA